MSPMQSAKTVIDRAVSALKSRPEIGQRTYTAKAEIKNGMVCRVSEKDIELIADIPCSMGGDGTGPSPSVLLRAAMASCAAIGIKMWAARKEITIDNINVQFETDVDARGQFGICDTIAPGFEHGRLRIEVLSPEDADRVREVVRQSLKYGPMMDAVRCRNPVETLVSVSKSQMEKVL